MQIKYSELVIENLETGFKTQWIFKDSFRGMVYEEIRKAMHQKRDLTIILDTAILFIPTSVVSVSALSINDLPPIYAPTLIGLKHG